MHSSRHGAVYTVHTYTIGSTHDKLGHAGRKLKSLVTESPSQEPTVIAPEQAEQAEGKGRSLLKADAAASTNHGGNGGYGGNRGYGGRNAWSTRE